MVEVNVDVDMVEVDFNKDKVGKLEILLRMSKFRDRLGFYLKFFNC